MCPGESPNLNGICRKKAEDVNISADILRMYQQNINKEQENNSMTLDIMVIYGIHFYLQKNLLLLDFWTKDIHYIEKHFHST